MVSRNGSESRPDAKLLEIFLTFGRTGISFRLTLSDTLSARCRHYR